MNGIAILSDLERFEATPPAQRLALAPAVAELAGPGFRACDELVGRKQMITVEHALTGLRFILVPGGRFSMGLTDRDIDRVQEVTDFESGIIQARIEQFEETCTPVHEVAVAPFLLSTDMASSNQIHAVTSGNFWDSGPDPEGLLQLIRMLEELRLPSESELEYAGREGGAAIFLNEGEVLWKKERRWPEESGWGLLSMTLASWAQDDWHPSYEGAPSTSVPWRSGGPPGVYRGCLMYTPESEDELLFALAAVRGRALPDGESFGCVRFACSLRI